MGREIKEMMILVINTQSSQSHTRTLSKKEKLLMIIALAGEIPLCLTVWFYSKLWASNQTSIVARKKDTGGKQQWIERYKSLPKTQLTIYGKTIQNDTNTYQTETIQNLTGDSANILLRWYIVLTWQKIFIYTRSRNQSYLVATPLLRISLLNVYTYVFYLYIQIFLYS